MAHVRFSDDESVTKPEDSHKRHLDESEKGPLAHDIYDPHQRFGTPTTPSMTSGFSVSGHENSLPGSPMVGNPSFPLADMSSVMFPNPDPFAYPNQQSGADAKFDDLLKNLQTVPLPLNEEQFQLEPDMPGTTLLPLTDQQYLGYQNLMADQQPAMSQEADVQLLGPMPMYMMQGASASTPYSSYNGMIPSNTPPAGNGSPVHPHQSKPLLRQTQIRSSAKQANPPNLNLDELLGGSEWNGLPADRSVIGFVQIPNENAYEGQGVGLNVTQGSFDLNPSLNMWQSQ
jgi:hypothetical protein